MFLTQWNSILALEKAMLLPAYQWGILGNIEKTPQNPESFHFTSNIPSALGAVFILALITGLSHAFRVDLWKISNNVF